MNTKTIEQTSLIQLSIGDRCRGDNDRTGTIVDMVLVPNGINDPALVALLYVKMDDTGNILSATSNRFYPVPKNHYKEFYPSVHHSKLEK